MPDEQELQDNTDREIATMTIFLSGKAAVTSVRLGEFIETAILQGVNPDDLRQELVNDLRSGGRIFGEFRNSLKATANGSINRFRDAGQFAEVEIDQTFRWAAVLVNTCPSCLARHNQDAMEWDEWVAIGLPRSGKTPCKERCRCMMVPDSEVKLNPIFRTKKQRNLA